MKDGAGKYIILIMFIPLIMYTVHYQAYNEPIKAKKPLTPELRIEIKNGEVDTTYIYKRP